MKRFVQGFILLQAVLLLLFLVQPVAGSAGLVSGDTAKGHPQQQTVISVSHLSTFVAGEKNQNPVTRLVCTSLKHVKGNFLEKNTALLLYQTQTYYRLFRVSTCIIPEFSKPDIVFPFNYHW